MLCNCSLLRLVIYFAAGVYATPPDPLGAIPSTERTLYHSRSCSVGYRLMLCAVQ